MSGPRTLFRRIVFFFCFSRVFLFFGSGSFYLLLGPPKTQKPRGKPKKLNLKNKKNQRILRNVWAPGPRTLFRGIVFFVVFWFSSSFFWVFGSGNFHRLLGLRRIKKQKEH